MSVEPPVPRTKGTPAVSLCVLKKRADFLRAARGQRVPAGSFLLQAYNRRDEDVALRVGYTCSKKVGNAVARNRAKRRLREAARLILLHHGQPGWDYVLIGRANQTAARDFQDLLSDLRRALSKVHGK
ncbi:ribonuclease P protein component [Thalassobacter stenotrophicus]|jgi:ribonuclease P protein component|uniref:ribonuclease P protein component n=1 Tax=Thalassobacter stenotrophicus TaxID=266809 RepID=UPI0022A937A6|nr:ribonuclease P protein component [Thalassobacter stenotrophicus]UYP68386.1 ribonuclease P protein component [Thalassobacter stenotrophicus]